MLELKRDMGMAESALTSPASSSEVRNHELRSIGTDVSNAFVICSVGGTVGERHRLKQGRERGAACESSGGDARPEARAASPRPKALSEYAHPAARAFQPGRARASRSATGCPGTESILPRRRGCA